jgi:hypothetical protein
VTPRHLDDLFSAAYGDELSPAEQTRFDQHMQTCEPCAAAYEEFKAGIAALKELPPARMPLAVHLPSTLPVAEKPSRPTIGLSWFNLGLLRRFPATAAAGAIALVLIILAIAHVGSGATQSVASLPDAAPGAAQVAPQAGHGTPAAASCTQLTTVTGSAPPISYAEETKVTDPAEPALHLVIAAPTEVVSAGSTVVLYAQLSVPTTSAGNPASTAATPPARALLPCVSVGVADTNQQLDVLRPGSEGLAIPQATGSSGASGASGFQSADAVPEYAFTVPAGLAKGTQIHVIANVPAGFAAFGSPPLTAELTLTIG